MCISFHRNPKKFENVHRFGPLHGVISRDQLFRNQLLRDQPLCNAAYVACLRISMQKGWDRGEVSGVMVAAV